MAITLSIVLINVLYFYEKVACYNRVSDLFIWRDIRVMLKGVSFMVKKRANGEGTIRKRKDGRWEARYVDIFEQDPRKRRKSIFGKSRKQVFDKLNEVLCNLKKKTSMPQESNMTVEQWMNKWMQTYGVVSYKHSTYSGNEMILEAYIYSHIGHIKLFDLSNLIIQNMFFELFHSGKKRSGQGLAPATLLKIKNVLSKGFHQAFCNHYMSSNPLEGLVLPPVKPPAIFLLSKKEQDMIGMTLFEHPFGYLIAILMGTGLRIGELLALECMDIDFEDKTIFINKTVSWTKDKNTKTFSFSIGTPKTKSSIRKISMMPNVEALIKLQLERVENIRAQNKEVWVENNLVFPNTYGGYQSQNRIRCLFIKMQKDLGINNPKTIHSLRHTFATNALNSGVSAQNLARVLGHKNGAITLEFYSHYIESEAYNQLCKLDQVNGQIFGLETMRATHK